MGPHRTWGLFAAAGYLAAAVAVLVLPWRWARPAAVTVALVGAVLAPLLVLVATGQGQSEVAVIERSGELLLRHGTPYLTEPQTVAEYTPYLPGMALLGLPHALLGAGPLVDSGLLVHAGLPVEAGRLLGDARLWCAAVFLGCLAADVRLRRSGTAPSTAAPLTAAPGGRAPSGGAMSAGRALAGTASADGTPADAASGSTLAVAALVASPLVALPLCVSGVDLPLTGLCCLALALAEGPRPRPFAAGLALALACALKWTAWPAVAVVAALLAAGGGRRAQPRAVASSVAAGDTATDATADTATATATATDGDATAARSPVAAAVTAVTTAVVGTAVLVLPVALRSPGALLEQVFAFPTGRGALPTPASSPLPGHLLAELGPVGWYAALALLLLAGLAVAGSLVLRPPRHAVAAADRLALGFALAFLLAPAGRFGYLALPVLLAVVARLRAARPAAASAPRPEPTRTTAPSPARSRTPEVLATP
ncbi:hypothetical protein [Kitasatospora sp. NPDC093806]|uniref:hypothetical protein n=1 Tax=Kitasatospora sp. NPDC093806 TaxID=3155075 RepID=UPI0034251CB8